MFQLYGMQNIQSYLKTKITQSVIKSLFNNVSQCLKRKKMAETISLKVYILL